MKDSLTTKTALLEDLRSEKRILQAEREEALRRLLGIQKDLEDITTMEKKLTLEMQSIERDLAIKCENEDYQLTRGYNSMRHSNVRKSHRPTEEA